MLSDFQLANALARNAKKDDVTGSYNEDWTHDVNLPSPVCGIFSSISLPLGHRVIESDESANRYPCRKEASYINPVTTIGEGTSQLKQVAKEGGVSIFFERHLDCFSFHWKQMLFAHRHVQVPEDSVELAFLLRRRDATDPHNGDNAEEEACKRGPRIRDSI